MHAHAQESNLWKANRSPSSQALASVNLYDLHSAWGLALPLNLPLSGLCCTNLHGESLKRVFQSRGADKSMMTEGRMPGKEREETSTGRSFKESRGKGEKIAMVCLANTSDDFFSSSIREGLTYPSVP